MLARIAMVTAIALSVLLFGSPEDALACHKGDPGIPHGGATSCDGGGGADLTNLVLVDANGNVVGPILNFDARFAHVIVFTPDQRPFRLPIFLADLMRGDGFKDFGSHLYYEEEGCPDTSGPYLIPTYGIPNIFHAFALRKDGAGAMPDFG